MDPKPDPKGSGGRRPSLDLPDDTGVGVGLDRILHGRRRHLRRYRVPEPSQTQNDGDSERSVGLGDPTLMLPSPLHVDSHPDTTGDDHGVS